MAGCLHSSFIIFVSLKFLVAFSVKTSICNQPNQPCNVLDWTPWSSCSMTGEQSRKSIICCTGLAEERCLRICNLQMSSEMKERKRNCTRKSTSKAAGSSTFSTGNATSAIHPSTTYIEPTPEKVTTNAANENQTLGSYTSTNTPDYEKSSESEIFFGKTGFSRGSTESLKTDNSNISNSRTALQSSTSPYPEKASSSNGPGYDITGNYVNNYFSTQGETENPVKSEASIARTYPSSTSGYQGKGNGTSNASQLSRNKEQDESGTGGGVIAGAIVGVLAVAGLSGLLAFFLYRRWKKNKEERKVEPEGKGGGDPVSQKPPVSTSLN